MQILYGNINVVSSLKLLFIINESLNNKIDNSFTAQRVLISNSNGKVQTSTVTQGELYYLLNASSNIQEQIKNFRNLIIVERKISEVVEVPAKNPKSIPLINLEKTGYTPIGIVGIAGIEGCFIYNYEVIGNELRSYIYNNTDITKTDSIRYQILYIKSL